MNRCLVVGMIIVFSTNIFSGERTESKKSNSRRSSTGPSEKDKLLSALHSAAGKSEAVAMPKGNRRSSKPVSPFPNSPTTYFAYADIGENPGLDGKISISPAYPSGR